MQLLIHALDTCFWCESPCVFIWPRVFKLTWVSMCLKSTTSGLFVIQIVDANNKENITAPHRWPFVRCPVDSLIKGPVMTSSYVCLNRYLKKCLQNSNQGWGQFLFFNSIPIPIPLSSIPIPIPIPLGWKIAIPIPIPFYQFQFLFINSFSIPF